MALVDVVMPQMGESIAEGTISKWHKKVGDKIAKDETLLEISTDKVDSEIPSPAAGVVAELLFQETTTVGVHTIIARINTDVNANVLSSTPPPVAKPEPAAPKPLAENLKPQTSQPTNETVAPTKSSSSNGSFIDVIMPQMGESIAEGTITKWHKKVGEKIGKDETLLEISTDKVDSEIPSPAAGVLAEILFPEQTTVGVHTVIARISSTGNVSVPVSTPVQPSSPKVESAKASTSMVQPVMHQQIPTDRFYSPLVLNIARTENVAMSELERIPGTGSGGRVSKKDILMYVEQKKGGKISAPTVGVPAPSYVFPKPAPPITYPAGRVEIIKMDTMRKAIAEHMVRSKHTSAHVGSVSEADVTGIVKFREKNKSAFEKREGFNLTYTPFFLDAVVKALKDYPMLNSSVDGDSIIIRKDINLGVAVALENGLIVPVIKNAEQKSLAGLARSLNDLATRARSKKLMPDEVTGGTFTVTNPGGFGNLYGFPIINQPQVAILGVGAIKKRPVVIDDAIAIRSMVYISMSYDHRIIDGALGGMFMQKVVFYLENFDVNQAV
ncbi:MAG: 2-oxoglutarate dehydrogenase, E2 component, dihydrolipoamide succinyltransferase [Ignavibacteriales bacterium]|nr:2-oxoglutarate dehydrogenase, E2 component, dihydrolipoamide succinyltransferase [Ignavibacteriales bacterium]